MYITKATTLPRSLGICLGKMKSDALTNQLVTFARGLRQALPVNDRDLPAATLNQSRVFQLSGRIRDGGPLGAQHLSENILRNQQSVIVATVLHHEEPARQPLRKAVGAVASDRYAARDILAALPGIWTKSLTEDVLAPRRACTPLHPSLPIVAISMVLPFA